MIDNRYFPTFWQMADRRHAPDDVMLCNDSWLAALMTDEILMAGLEYDDVAPDHRWQIIFKKVLNDLQFFGWRETCALHLS